MEWVSGVDVGFGFLLEPFFSLSLFCCYSRKKGGFSGFLGSWVGGCGGISIGVG